MQVKGTGSEDMYVFAWTIELGPNLLALATQKKCSVNTVPLVTRRDALPRSVAFIEASMHIFQVSTLARINEALPIYTIDP